jgi:hypothetical protein
MNITVFTKDNTQDGYLSSQDAISKDEAYSAISSKYTNDTIEKITVKYDDIDESTVDGKRATEPGDFVTVSTLEELKAELGKYTG